ncbi:glycosyltransferase family 4 protein [Chryseobacterium taihuense]|uniref:Glycosyltransferase involved in cell wall bisynthesis n=1 Tax=Chryseobacterium taihuense TaxID=1141221 RepID=A0ABY0QSR3_9FLAO|nr:glycosyltransferase family 4 protein [Chryseobacterium taihuense]SDL77261.1 Glycosyltransferase involved in cell wall bisynthesis [Chryseobacterium taihuense]
MIKIIRTSTISTSLNILLKGQLKKLSEEFEIIALSSNDGHLEEVSSREKVKTIAVDMERGISPIKDLISLLKLYRQFKKEKPTVVHSITPKAGLLTMLAGKMAGVPVRMHTFTGLIFPTRTGLMQKFLIKMDQLLCWAATHVYPEGNGVKNDLIRFKITSKPLKVLANGNVNGIDLNFFSLDAVSAEKKQILNVELKIAADDFVFVFVGRLVGDKGINELVKAFSLIKNQKVKLLLVGSFEPQLDPLMPSTLYEIAINANIISVGFQNDVRPYFAISDALIFPSYREGFPNVVIQAGAMELPSIVSDISGCNEIIVNGRNGIIIPVKDSEAIKLTMHKMMDDKKFYEEMKENTRPMVESRYNQQLVWNAVAQEYKLIISQLKK